MNTDDKDNSQSDFESKQFAVYILGAGFSKPAGLPLASELWEEIRKKGLGLTGRASMFRDDLKAYIEYKKKCDNLELTPWSVNFEDFMAFLDIEHYLGLRGGDTWSSQGNEGQLVVKTLIGELLAAATPPKDKIPKLYLDFARILKPLDIILTFNYDLLLERALEAVGVRYRLFPTRHKDDPDLPGKLMVDDRDEVLVAKLHGSIDWFDRSDYAYLEEERIRNGFTTKTSDLIFERPKDFGALPLIEGPHYANDPLNNIYRIRDIERLYRRGVLFFATPSLLNPSSTKLLYSKMYRDFWSGMGRAGVLNFRMAIIGYSLPSQDEYARQIIYRIVRNYQTAYWKYNKLKHKKAPLVLIDFRKSKEDVESYRKRYRFVNWRRAVTSLNGFDEEAIRILQK